MLRKHLFNEAQGRVGLILVLRFREVTSEVASPDMVARGQKEELFSALQAGRENEAPV